MPKQRWLLLRGLGRQSAHWGAFVPQLQAAFPQIEVHCLDLPGTGRMTHQASPNSIVAIVSLVRQQALVDGLLDRPCVLLGLSLGGMVAWQWAQQFPQDIGRTVVINSSFASLNPFYQRLRWQCYGRFAQLLLAPAGLARERRIVQLVSNSSPVIQQATAVAWAAVHLRQPMSLATIVAQLQAAAGFRPALSLPKGPVLLLNSLGDRLVAPACSFAIQQQWQLPLHQHPTAGHDLPLDAPQWVIERLSEVVGDRY